MTDLHTIHLKTQDGGELSFECSEEEHLIDAGIRAGIHLPSGCKAGGCGACRAHAAGGEYDLKPYSTAVLPKERAAAGDILMCRTFPKGPMTVEVPKDLADIAAGPMPEHLGEIVINEDMGGGVRRLLLKLEPDAEGSVEAEFEAGQFMELELPGTDIRRAYSFSNISNSEGLMEFLIRLQPDGKFSAWLEQSAEAGDKLRVCGPQGEFKLNSSSAPRRFVAGGTGVAPMFSMLRQMAASNETNESRLYFGVNRESELFAEDELEALQAEMPNLTVETCVWKPEGDWNGFTGSPADALKRDLAEDIRQGVEPEVYLCGPPGLVDATESAAREAGLSEEQIFCERFVAGQ